MFIYTMKLLLLLRIRTFVIKNVGTINILILLTVPTSLQSGGKYLVKVSSTQSTEYYPLKYFLI
jgi:hypothetical protein